MSTNSFDIKRSYIRTLLVLSAILLTLFTLVTPTPARALESLTCPAGSNLRWSRIYFVASGWRCVDNQGNETRPSRAPVSSCPAGQVEVQDKDNPNDDICAPPGTTQSSATSCSANWGNWGPFFNPLCWGRLIGAVVAGVLAWLGAMILSIAGNLFNYLLVATVIGFKTVIYKEIGSAIETGWTVFRDIANIGIIGIFTFIALSIIMGLKTYGQKKLIANVLIVAVLINFSLLFTKIVIDASNFVAYQFYQATVMRATTVGTFMGEEGGLPEASNNADISGKFMKAIGITGYLDTYRQVKDISEKNDNGFVGFGFGILSFIYLVGAALVLFYGCFLLVARAVILIFLMLTSAAAFATYLIPTLEKSAYGWKTWSESLAKTAIFAPLLMLFLWITLAIATRLGPIMNNKTIGGATSAPADNVTAIFGYILILGMLFLSFKLSSKFASQIAGFSMASMVPGAALGLAAGATGFLGRNVAGRGMAALRGKMQNAGWTDAEKHTGIKGWAMRKTVMGANKVAKTNFNPLQNKTIAKASSALGVPKILTGGDSGKGGYDAVTKKKAEAAASYEKEIAPTKAYMEQKKKSAAEAKMKEVSDAQAQVAAKIADLKAEAAKVAEAERADILHGDENLRQKEVERDVIEKELSEIQQTEGHRMQEAIAAQAGKKGDKDGRREKAIAENRIDRGVEMADIAANAHTKAEEATGKATALAKASENAREKVAQTREQAIALKAEADASPGSTEKAAQAASARDAFIQAANTAEELSKQAAAARKEENKARKDAAEKAAEAFDVLKKTAPTTPPTAPTAPTAPSTPGAGGGAPSSGPSGPTTRVETHTVLERTVTTDHTPGGGQPPPLSPEQIRATKEKIKLLREQLLVAKLGLAERKEIQGTIEKLTAEIERGTEREENATSTPLATGGAAPARSGDANGTAPTLETTAQVGEVAADRPVVAMQGTVTPAGETGVARPVAATSRTAVPTGEIGVERPVAATSRTAVPTGETGTERLSVPPRPDQAERPAAPARPSEGTTGTQPATTMNLGATVATPAPTRPQTPEVPGTTTGQSQAPVIDRAAPRGPIQAPAEVEGAERIRAAQTRLARINEEHEQAKRKAESKVQEETGQSPRLQQIKNDIHEQEQKLVEIQKSHGVTTDLGSAAAGRRAIENAGKKASEEADRNTHVALTKTLVWDPGVRAKIEDQIRGREKKEKLVDWATMFKAEGVTEISGEPAPAPAPTPAPSPTPPSTPAPEGGTH